MRVSSLSLSTYFGTNYIRVHSRNRFSRFFSTEKANAVVQAINDAEPGRAIAVVGDVLDANYIENLVKKAAEFGNGKIHIIVNNAGFTWDGVIHKVR